MRAAIFTLIVQLLLLLPTSVAAKPQAEQQILNRNRTEVGDFETVPTHDCDSVVRGRLLSNSDLRLNQGIRLQVLSVQEKYAEAIGILQYQLSKDRDDSKVLSQLRNLHLQYAAYLSKKNDLVGAAREYNLAHELENKLP